MRYLFIFIALVISIPIRSEEYPFRLNEIDAKSDFSTFGSVSAVFQDHRGYLWIGGDNGIVLWDGYTKVLYQNDLSDSNSISSNIIYFIKEDAQKRLWIGTINGLNLYVPEIDGFKKIAINNKFENIPVNDMVQDRDGIIWLATSNGLCRLDNGLNTSWYYHHDDDPASLSNDVLFSIEYDYKQTLWIGTFQYGLNAFDIKTKQSKSYLNTGSQKGLIPENTISSLLYASNNTLWIGLQQSGLLEWNVETDVKTFHKETSGTSPIEGISAIYEDRFQTLWYAVKNGAVFFRKKNQTKFSRFTPQSNACKKELKGVTVLSEDIFGNLWLGTSNNGLFYSNIFKNKFRNINATNATNNADYTALCKDPQFGLWAGTLDGTLYHYAPQSEKCEVIALPGKNDNVSIQTLYIDKRKNLWIGTKNHGLFQRHLPSGQWKHFEYKASDRFGLHFQSITSLAETDTALFIASYGMGLAYYHFEKNKFYHSNNATHFPFIAPGWINHIYIDSQNRFWVAAYGGLYMIQNNGLTHFKQDKTNPKSIINQDVLFVREDGNKNIWIVTVDGFLEKYHENDKSFEHTKWYTNEKIQIKTLQFNSRNEMWLGAKDGLYYVQNNQSIRKITAEQGLSCIPWYAQACIVEKSGLLYIAGKNGIFAFDPNEISRIPLSSTFYFKDLYIEGQRIKPDAEGKYLKQILNNEKSIVLPHDVSFFDITFSTVNLFASDIYRFQYRIRSNQEQWMDVSEKNRVRFSGLAPGNYVLEFRKTKDDISWEQMDALLQIEILPPWWNTILAKIFYVLILLSGLVLGFRYRTHQIRKQNKILNEQVAVRTNELNQKNKLLIDRHEEITQQSVQILQQKEKIEDQNKNLERLIAELKKSDETKNLFFNILAHDLKGPIGAIVQLVQLLLGEASILASDQTKEIVQHLNKSAKNTSDLLLNLLSWARVQNHTLQAEPTAHPISYFIQKNIHLLEQSILLKKITINNLADPTVWIWSDKDMTDTVVRNLISNAIKFTPVGGTIEMRTTLENDRPVLYIQDNGVGMDEEKLKKIFDIGTRHTGIGTQGERGTGLGLILCKTFLEMNASNLSLSSKPGQGTTVKISFLPAEKSEEISSNDLNQIYPVKNILKPIEPILSETGQHSTTVLLIEDQEEIRAYIKRVLEPHYNVIEAANGLAGYHSAIANMPDMIITDIVMPEMDGKEFCSKIKANPDTCHIPVVILTSETSSENRLAGYHSGAEIYLTKPAEGSLIIQVLQNILSYREKIRAQVLGKTEEQILEKDKLMPSDQKLLDNINRYIEEHLSDTNLDATRLIKLVGISRSVLYAKFKSITGSGLNEYIRDFRLKRSLLLLQTSDKNINEIADETGFTTASYFIRCFSVAYQMTPKEFRASLKK